MKRPRIRKPLKPKEGTKHVSVTRPLTLKNVKKLSTSDVQSLFQAEK